MLVNRVHKPYFCTICKKTAGVKVCKCQKVFYCSRNCQKIDWTTHRENCCTKLQANRSASNNNNNNCASSSSCANNSLSLQENFNVSVLQAHDDEEHNTVAIREGQKQYDPTPLQYQQSDAIYSHSENFSTANLTVNDFDENLFNLMSAVVDEGTEEEFLRSLNIRADELLSAYSLEGNNFVPTTTSTQVLKEYMPVENTFVDDQLSEKLFEQIHCKRSYDFKPETQQLLKETKENLEKELSLFCESQHLADDMQLNSQNPKYVNHTTVQDNNTMRSPDEQLALEDMCHNLISDLNSYGVCVLDSFVGEQRGLKVLSEVKEMYTAGKFKDGQLVGATKKVDQKHIRSDKIMWVEGKEEDGLPNIKYLMNQVDAVISMANRMNNNGKLGQHSIRERTKAMVACYEGKGSHYVKHVDNPNKDGRCITCIYYLNVNWDSSEDGGLLRIYPAGWTDRVADVEPIFDRITFFWSDRRNPHEVQPSHRTRYAITLWYFDAHERELAVRKYQKDCENLRKKA